MECSVGTLLVVPYRIEVPAYVPISSDRMVEAADGLNASQNEVFKYSYC